MASFNVLTEPWIPVRDCDGRIQEIGILKAIEQAHRLAEITDPSPPIQFGLYRLLVAFVMDALRIRELEDIVDVLAGDGFDIGQIHHYVDECGEAFDLFSADRPFLQSVGEPKPNTKRKPIAELVQHLPSGTFATFFHHGLAEDHAFSPAVCARMLCSVAPFMTAGGAGLSPSINGNPLWYTLVRGSSLFQTVLLNTCALPGPWSDEQGFPSWRCLDPVTPKKEVNRFSLLGGLTWRPRFVRLEPSGEGQCTYTGRRSAVLIKRMVFEPGLRAVNDSGVWIDPQAPYRFTPKGPAPLRPREERPIWRDTGPVALLRKGEYVSDKGKVQFERPLVATQYRLLQQEGAISSEAPLEIDCFGIRTDGNMKIFEWQTERLTIPPDVLANPDAGRQVQESMDLASWVDNTLRNSLKAAYPEHGKRNQKAFHGLIADVQRRFWTSLHPRFEQDFLGAVARQDPDDKDAAGDLRASWIQILQREGITALDSVLDQLDSDAAAVRRQVRAREVFWHQLAKIGPQDKTAADQTMPAKETRT